jgi:hypothetical protein
MVSNREGQEADRKLHTYARMRVPYYVINGVYENKKDIWLRWCDQDGNLVLTGRERAEQEHQRAERLAEKLRTLGIDPDLVR